MRLEQDRCRAYALLFYTIKIFLIYKVFLCNQSNIRMLASGHIIFNKCDSIVVGIYD